MLRPPVEQYQQLREPITGRYDCGAYSAAMAAFADSRGRWKLTGRQVRLATDEPVPDPKSPGLNLRQTDDALFLLTKGEVNLDTQWRAPWSRVETNLRAGRWGHLCVTRGPLVDAGFSGGDRFRGRHGILIGYDKAESTPILADPLVPYYQNVTWAALKRAAGAFAPDVGFGAADIAFTRIVADTPVPPQPRYSVRFTRQSFFAYRVNAWTLKVIDREPRKFGGATSAPCEAPRWMNWPGHGGPLVTPDDSQDEVSLKRAGNRKLALVKAGGLKGLYVEPGASGISLVVSK